jgi:hypothetical protein
MASALVEQTSVITRYVFHPSHPELARRFTVKTAPVKGVPLHAPVPAPGSPARFARSGGREEKSFPKVVRFGRGITAGFRPLDCNDNVSSSPMKSFTNKIVGGWFSFRGAPGACRFVPLLTGVLAFGFFPAAAEAQFVTEVVMSGLNNPRGLASAPDGSLYVTEAGSPFVPPPGTPFVISQGAPLYYNTSGSISRLQGGTQSRIITGLPSLFAPPMGDIGGPNGIGFSSTGEMYFTVGLGSDPRTRGSGVLANLGLLMRVPAGGGIPVVVADVSGFEALNNPAGGPFDSNPFQILVRPSGVLVADAGANAILSVGPGGVVSLVATLGPAPGGGEPVPTSLAMAPDGTVYVSQLTGFPFPVGGASVFRLNGSTLTSISSGFTNVVDMEYGPDGLLYVLEIAHFGLRSGDPTGGLWQVNPLTGAKNLIMTDGLILPTALTFDSAGRLYIANQGVIPGQGQVLAVTPVPEPSTWGAGAALFLAGLIAQRRIRAHPSGYLQKPSTNT